MRCTNKLAANVIHDSYDTIDGLGGNDGNDTISDGKLEFMTSGVINGVAYQAYTFTDEILHLNSEGICLLQNLFLEASQWLFLDEGVRKLLNILQLRLFQQDWRDIEHRQPRSLRSNPRPHNHRVKTASALSLWVLVFSSDFDVGSRLNLAYDQINSTFHYMFSSNGVYVDGADYYWDFSIFQMLPTFTHRMNIGSANSFPALTPIFEWIVRDSVDMGWLPNLEDSWYKLNWTAMITNEYISGCDRRHSNVKQTK